MLHFVFGRSGYGKTEYVFKAICDLALNNNDNIMLITPEQYSLVAERRLLKTLGESKMACVENSGFSRISNEVKRKYGGDNLPILTKGGKAIIMTQAIDAVSSSLTLFTKKLDTLDFVNSMVKIYDEMRSCNLSSSEITELSKSIEQDVLFKKMSDIALIMQKYEQLIENRFYDSADELTRLYNKIKDIGYFKGKKVFIDGFNGFVAQEYKILELVISEADEVTITLCTDSFEDEKQYDLFKYVNNSAHILEKIAKKANIEIKYTQLTENRRTDSDELIAVEKQFSNSDEKTIKGDVQNVTLYATKSISDECSQTARQIRKLLRNGCKASDITVITRDINKYRDELSCAFKKYEIPYFNDERQPVKTQPLVLFITYLLRCVNFSLKSDDILSLIKTDLTPIELSDINALENYTYMWNINGSKWCKPFVNSTKGFVDEISESDKAQLEKINSVREQVITPILKFKNAVKNADAKGICTAIYNSLIDFRVDEQIRKYAVGLSELNQNALAAEQGRVWDMVMEILNQMSSAIYGEKIMLKEFAKLFSLVISTEDLGTLPQGIDNVQFGQADRIRTDNPSAVFILGANEGEFPQTISKGGILSEADRQILLKNDFKLYSYGEILNIQERYFAYMACAAPRDYLHISYIGNSSREVAPSEIVTSVKSALPDIATVNCNSISDIDLIETKETAFELMSEHYFDTDVFYSSLKEYFSNDMRFPAIKSLAEDEQIKIKNNKTATELFNYNMLVSASRIEDFYNCPFRYFCKFGLSAKPREKAEMNPMQRGTIIHYVLEMILSNYGSKKLSDMTKCEIKNLVDGYIQSYFTEQMGNVEDLSVRFKYNYIRLSKMIYGVVEQLADEFSNSDFEAKAFELKIDKDADVKPEIITLDDGGTVQIRGFIDRVDTFTKDNQRYVRVVDYKSGNKDFNLSDIMYGLNLQMFVYLFSLCSDKTAKLNGIPAGVLYMHASRNIVSFHSKSEAEMYASSDKSNSLKMKGIVLSDENNEIPKAMEHDLEGKYIPVKLKRNGELYGQFASLEQLGLLHKKINALIAEMGTELHMGNVSQNPVKNKNHKMTCEYCDYSDVCAGRRTIDERIAEDLTDDEVKTILSREFEENATMDTATE